LVGDGRPTISSDGLELYFGSERAGGLGDNDLYVATRPSPNDPWGEPVNLGPPVNTSVREGGPELSPDDLSLFFQSDRPGGSGGTDLHVMTRLTKNAAWGTPVNLGPTVNSSDNDGLPSISADGLELFFQSPRSGGFGNADLYVTTRPTIHDDWGTPVNLGSIVNTSDHDWGPNILSDRLTLYFYSPRPGGFGSNDIYMTRRPTIDDDWSEPVNLGPIINSSSKDGAPTFSADGSMLYFLSTRPGGFGDYDLYQAPIIPIVDFTGDYKIDIDDLIILIEHWGQNEPSVDIGPTPLGDGVVDAEDLKVLLSYWGQEPYDPHLIAHWKLDETEGDVAYDSAAQNDAIVMGDAVWRPNTGQIEGALQFDGVDDVIIVQPVLNPEDGPFSAFAWVKGGAPGQVILSQEDGVTWLMADAEEGALRTDISDPIQKARHGTVGGLPLIAPAVMTDGNWHHVGFVWDGSNRILYVDDVVVAEDTQPNLAGATGDLRIGANSDFEPGTFWSGLIDDVRVYDRVVVP